MGLGNVMQANGSLVRACSEFNLLKMEDMKRVRSESKICLARTKELDGITQESNTSTRKSVDSFFQEQEAIEARNAAIAGFVAALAGAASSIAGASGRQADGSSGSKFDIASAIIKGTFSALGAFFALLGAWQEMDMVKQQHGVLSKDAKEDSDRVAALDGNPTC